MQAARCLPASMRRAAARLCSAMRLLTAFMVSIHLGDCRKCSQHWLHFEPPSLPSPPPCVFCTQAAGRQGQSPWDSCTGCVVPSHYAE